MEPTEQCDDLLLKLRDDASEILLGLVEDLNSPGDEFSLHLPPANTFRSASGLSDADWEKELWALAGAVYGSLVTLLFHGRKGKLPENSLVNWIPALRATTFLNGANNNETKLPLHLREAILDLLEMVTAIAYGFATASYTQIGLKTVAQLHGEDEPEGVTPIWQTVERCVSKTLSSLWGPIWEGRADVSHMSLVIFWR